MTEDGSHPGVYLIEFTGGTLVGTNVRPLSVRDASGVVAQNEVQHVQLLNATGGTFTLTLGGQTTAPLQWNANANTGAGNVQSAVGALTSLPTGVTVSVSGSAGNYTITFLGGKHVDKLVGDSGALENATTTMSFTIAGFTATSNTTAAQLVAQLQTALNNAAVAGGVTPGFLTATVTSGAGVTAGRRSSAPSRA